MATKTRPGVHCSGTAHGRHAAAAATELRYSEDGQDRFAKCAGCGKEISSFYIESDGDRLGRWTSWWEVLG